MKPNATKSLFRAILIVGCAAGIIIPLLTFTSTVAAPNERRIAEFTGGDLSIELTPEYSSPYQFLISVPAGSTEPPTFRGSIELRDHSGIVATIPISSETVQSCNWLQDVPGVSAYILTWSAPQQLGDILHRGTTYQVRVTFSEPLPAGCSLWFSSLHYAASIFCEEKGVAS